MTLANRYPVARDIAERVVATFVVTMLGLATADGIDWQDWGDWGHWQAWATSALAAAFSLLKGVIAVRVGRPSASLDPAVALAPVAGGSANV